MQFYVLEKAPTGQHETARTDALTADGAAFGAAPRCDVCGKYIGLRPWLPPYRIELDTWGHDFGDLAFKNVGTDILVSLRFMELWQGHGLVGLSGFEPVEIVKVRRHRKFVGEPPPYFKAAVVLGQAAVDNVASGVECEEPATCPACRLGSGIKRWKAIIIEPGTWSGEDIFIPRWAGDFLVTSRFKAFCEANEVRNAVFVPAETYGHDFYPWEHKSQSNPPSTDASGPTATRILGVHPISAAQPCHLIEMEVESQTGEFDWGAVTQEDSRQDRSNWQVAYSETPLNEAKTRWAFFFHYLDFSKPLLTPTGPLKLPEPTPLPEYLKQVEYFEP